MSNINDLHGGVRRSAFVEYCRHCKHLMTPDHECADLRDEKTRVEKLGAEIKRLDPTPPSRIDWMAVLADMPVYDEFVTKARLPMNVDADQEWKTKLKIDAAWVPEPSILGRLSRRAREMWAAARRAVGL